MQIIGCDLFGCLFKIIGYGVIVIKNTFKLFREIICFVANVVAVCLEILTVDIFSPSFEIYSHRV